MLLPYKPQAYQLLHDGALTLAEIEGNGIQIDVEYLDKAIADTNAKIADLNKKLQKSEVVEKWKKAFGHKANLNSNEQLGKVLFEVMGFECPERTDTGRYKTDEKTLASVDHQFVKDWLEIKKLDKAVGTFLMGIRREVFDGLLHPSFNLHLAETFRSSSDSPNFQNLPVRNLEIMTLVRSAIIPRKGRRLIEIDYKGVEVAVAACYHKDPTMITYIKDKTKDMHRDMAAACYKLKVDQVTKMARYAAKNKFVFPQFYGSWYPDCAKSLWQGIDELKLETKNGVPMKQHLASQGITELGECSYKEKPAPGTFAHHIMMVEKHFWGKRFPVYAQWKRDHFERYKTTGYITTKTGFICQGYMKRNEVINYPVQGAAFHALLWALIRMQRAIKKYKMKSLLVGQIHDCVLGDVPENEDAQFCEMAQDIMVDKLMKAWKWLIVPLEIEIEKTPVDGSWNLKACEK